MQTKLDESLNGSGLTGKAHVAGELWRIRITDGGRAPSFVASATVGDEQALAAFIGRAKQYRAMWLECFPTTLIGMWYSEETSKDGHIYITIGNVLAQLAKRHFSASPTDEDIYAMLKQVVNGGME